MNQKERRAYPSVANKDLKVRENLKIKPNDFAQKIKIDLKVATLLKSLAVNLVCHKVKNSRLYQLHSISRARVSYEHVKDAHKLVPVIYWIKKTRFVRKHRKRTERTECLLVVGINLLPHEVSCDFVD